MRFKNPTCKLEKNNEEAEDGTPLRPNILSEKELKRIEEMEDCFILDFNPCDSIDIAKLSVANDGDVASRDYPHSRHLCLQFPFDATPHERHCDLCYCHVCDLDAPCECWMTYSHASEHVEDWKSQRNLRILKVRPRKL